MNLAGKYLESGIFGEMLATNNVIMQEDRQITSTRHLERQL